MEFKELYKQMQHHTNVEMLGKGAKESVDMPKRKQHEQSTTRPRPRPTEHPRFQGTSRNNGVRHIPI